MHRNKNKKPLFTKMLFKGHKQVLLRVNLVLVDLNAKVMIALIAININVLLL